jgi:hypothetical protein
MPDEPRPPHDTPSETSEGSPQDPPTSAVVLSFLEHLSKRRAQAPASVSKAPAAPPARDEPEVPDVLAALSRAAQEPTDTSTAPPDAGLDVDTTHNPDGADGAGAHDDDAGAHDDAWSGADKVVNLDDIRRLRQQAADANLPESPLLRYLFEHLMPSYSGGPVNLEVRPEFLQEHARPLLSLLLQSVADSLDGRRVTAAAQGAPAAADAAAPTGQEVPASAPAATAPPPMDASSTVGAAAPPQQEARPPMDEQTIEIKKSVSFNLDLSKLFRQLFSRTPPDGDGSP